MKSEVKSEGLNIWARKKIWVADRTADSLKDKITYDFFWFQHFFINVDELILVIFWKHRKFLIEGGAVIEFALIGLATKVTNKFICYPCSELNIWVGSKSFPFDVKTYTFCGISGELSNSGLKSFLWYELDERPLEWKNNDFLCFLWSFGDKN